MVKGLIGSLIAAAVFFTAGGITAAIMGTNANPLKSFKKFGDDFDNLLLDSDTDGTWYFDNTPELSLGLSSAKTTITPIEGDQISLSVSSEDASIGVSRLSVKAALNSDKSRLAISVSRNGFFIFDISSITVAIGLPKCVYNRFELSLGSGSVDAKEVNALTNDISVGSGKLFFRQNEDFTANIMDISMGSGAIEITRSAAEYLAINIGSGSLIMDTAKTSQFDINMGSGRFEVNGLSGSGNIDVASGNGIARFSDTSGIDGTELDLSSGKLAVYLPNDTSARINTDISSGSVVVDCCGVNDKLGTDDESVTLGNGAAEISADVSSGKLSILENDTVIGAVTVTGEAVQGTENE